MDQQAIVNYWRESAERDWRAAKDMLKGGHRSWALFLCHLSLEKSFKAIIAGQGKEIPYIHELIRLAREAGLTVDQTLTTQLNEITTFNLEARYDDFKQAFYKKATLAYAEQWMKLGEEIYLWLKNQS
ncbi:MAG: HEPN domain-containing protein [Patescibacteria group bacterium]